MDTSALTKDPMHSMPAQHIPGGALVGANHPRAQAERNNGSRFSFVILLAFVLVEFVRPQNLVPVFGVIRPALSMSLLLGVAVWANWHRVPWREPIFLLMAAMIAIAALWVPLATNNYWAFQTFRFLVQQYLFCLGAATFIDSKKRFLIFLMFFLGCLVFQGLWSIGHGGRGTGGFLGDENDLATAMAVGIPVATYGLFGFGRWVRGMGLLCAALFVGAIATSASRGGLVALAVTAFMMLMVSRRRVTSLVGMGIAVALLVTFTPRTYWDEMRTMFDPEEGTRTARVRMWEGAWLVFSNNPILGVGPGNVPWTVSRYEKGNNPRSYAGRAVHSAYFTIIAEWGVLGLFLYGTLWVLILRYLTRVIRARGDPVGGSIARAVLCAFVAYSAAGLFLSVLYYPYLYWFALLGYLTWRFELAGRLTADVASEFPGESAPELGARA